MVPDALDADVATVETDRSLTPLYWLGIGLAAVTGAIHLWLGVVDGHAPLVVAGVGFAVGIAAVALDYRRDEFVSLGLPFTAGQIVLYTIGHYPEFATVELVDKAAQLALVAVLAMLSFEQ